MGGISAKISYILQFNFQRDTNAAQARKNLMRLIIKTPIGTDQKLFCPFWKFLVPVWKGRSIMEKN